MQQFLRSAEPAHHVVIPLASVGSAGVEPAFASALGLTPGPAIRPVDGVVAALAKTSGLLVVDNCEHVADAVRGLLTTVLDTCERWSVVTTSRVALGLPDEHLLALAPLPVPGGVPVDLDEVLAVPSVQLFEDRARRRATNFAVANTNADDIARICRRLDGLPLAIELAAAWVAVLSVAAIEKQLAGDLLGVAPAARVAEARHITLDACITWSLGLVSEEELDLLRHLAVFDGPVELSTAAALTGGDVRAVLAALVAASLVVADQSSGRFSLLQTVREAVRRHTPAEAENALRSAHLRAVCQSGRSRVGRAVSMLDGHEAATAVAWAASQGRADDAMELVGVLADVWWRRPDGRSVLDLAVATRGGSPRRRAETLIARALVAVTTLDYNTALADGSEAVNIAVALGDGPLEGRARRWLGWALTQVDPTAAREQFEAARRLLDSGADTRALGEVFCGLAALAATEGDPVRARHHLDEVAALADVGEADASQTYALAWSALANLQQGRVEVARAEADEAKRRARVLGSGLYTLFGLTWSTWASLRLGDLTAARAYVAEAGDLIADGWADLTPFVDVLRGELALADGDAHGAVELLSFAAPVVCAASPVLGAVILAELAEALARVGRLDDARRALGDALSIVGDGDGRPWARATVALTAARVALAAADAGDAHDHALDALSHSAAVDDVVTGAAALDVPTQRAPPCRATTTAPAATRPSLTCRAHRASGCTGGRSSIAWPIRCPAPGRLM